MTFYRSGHSDGGPQPAPVEMRWSTMYASASAAAPRNRLMRAVRAHVDLLSSSGFLMATTVVTSVLGFAYWWLAARLFAAEAVGAASAAVSAMTLIGTLGMFGMGTLLIAELPRVRAGREWNLLSACVLTAGGAALAGGIGYAVLAQLAVPGLRAALGSPLELLLLLVGISANAMVLVLDEGLIGLQAGRLQLTRNTVFALGKLVAVAALAVLPVTVTGGEILATWVGGILISVLLLAHSLRRRSLLPSVRPDFPALRRLRRRAFGHNALNLSLFLPRTTLPLIVAAVVSTSATAHFYTAWMITAFLAMIPGSLATSLFAVASGDAAAIRAKTRMALLVSVGAGAPAALVVAAAARPIMGVFGAGYAQNAGGVLAILALTYVPGVFRQLFVAVSRVQRRVRRATGIAVVAGLAEVGAAWYGGSSGDLTRLVTWYAVVVAVEGALMAPTVLRVALFRAPGRHTARAQQQALIRRQREPAVAEQPNYQHVTAQPDRQTRAAA